MLNVESIQPVLWQQHHVDVFFPTALATVFDLILRGGEEAGCDCHLPLTGNVASCMQVQPSGPCQFQEISGVCGTIVQV
jgi:hypothetical protein